MAAHAYIACAYIVCVARALLHARAVAQLVAKRGSNSDIAAAKTASPIAQDAIGLDASTHTNNKCLCAGEIKLAQIKLTLLCALLSGLIRDNAQSASRRAAITSAERV